ncbi:MAG: rubredoxin [Candidatus Aminicenantes bacterium]|nr:rubredoxin [Candidatus Aminicenantes bacterium]
MAIYRCNFCNAYDYDEKKGDSSLGIKPGTQPVDFPDNWVCPICGHDKTHLDPV